MNEAINKLYALLRHNFFLIIFLHDETQQ